MNAMLSKEGDKMSWVEIHDEILGTKLRGLRKRLNCSDVCAVGVLAVLWLWASKNADEEGLLANTDRSDIASALRPHVGNANPDAIVDALVECGWIDESEGLLSIHDWSIWQSDAIVLAGRRAADRERQQKHRVKQKEKAEEKKEKQKAKPKKEKPQKIQYAEAVTLTEAEHDKLVAEHGEQLVKECIEILSNYKLSSGRKYASDYHAILNWVVKRATEDRQKAKPQYSRKPESWEQKSSSINDEMLEQIMNPYASKG